MQFSKNVVALFVLTVIVTYSVPLFSSAPSVLEHFACLPEGIERYVVLREHSVCMFDCVISQKGFYVFLFFVV